MAFLAFLLMLIVGAGVFGLLAFLLRERMRRVAQVMAAIGAVIALLLLGLWIVEVTNWEEKGVYKQLMFGLEQPELQYFLEEQEDLEEHMLVFASQTSWSLHQFSEAWPEEKNRIAARLSWLAAYVTDRDRFPIWERSTDWQNEAFFLSQAAIVLGHYQITTLDESYTADWSRICSYLASGIKRSKYKHLASRPQDSALRPTDNAAALYALSLHDAYFDSNLLADTAEDWENYIDKELRYEQTRFPCAGFTATNRCRLSPVGSSFAWLNVYTTALDRPAARGYWRDFKHYYKDVFAFVAAWVEELPAGVETTEFCDFSSMPLRCNSYGSVLGLQGASQRQDWLTYYQLNNVMLLNDLRDPPNRLWQRPLQEQLYGMIRLSTRLAALTAH